ncbi:unnamed protein product [Clonostachys rhizophaga]|uniref:Major facilitator superfamily (MFS) profile domain-containing protein n=1 Tax=Clonostachys rhizophaga TaxID=160324 RepID=A0A9N9W0C7_9HYPO|nr:unnamed protein product [Clonostachys rhizophaga]
MTQAGLALSLVPLRIIGASFNTTNAGELGWYAASYILTVGTFILIAGRLGDVFGHRLVFIIGFAWFSLWSLLGGIAVWSDKIFFDICRAMQGIGPALLLPNSIAILGRTYRPGPRKNMIFSIFGATAPACACLALMGWLILPRSPSDWANDKDMSIMARLDMPGSLTGVIGLILVNFAWNLGPVFLEVIKGDTPLLASAKWSGVSVSGAIAAVTTGYLISRIRPSLIMLMAMVVFTVGQILLATLPVNQTYWAQAFLITVITPWGT